MRYLRFAFFLCAILLSCSKEEIGISSIDNPYADRQVSVYGGVVTVGFVADAAWTAELSLSDAGSWARISKVQGNESSGAGKVQVNFSTNKSASERSAELYVSVEGALDRIHIATLVQAAGENVSSLSSYLNSYMHERLVKEYLWAEEYASLDIDMTVPYDEFLSKHLLKLDCNIEDGGIWRSNMPDPGQRFIYTNIQDVTPVSVKAAQTGGLGFGPMFASKLYDDVYGLSVAYVHDGSPAHKAGMRRGDTIYKVNGKVMTSDLYASFMNQLYASPSGSYTFEFIRDADVSKSYTASVSCADYIYNPILFSAIISEKEHKIGYVVLENFDLYSQEFVADIVRQLKDAAITDLILDLRFNPGGAVAQSRYLASAIAGAANLDKTFVKVTFRDGRNQDWKFRGGPNDEDGLGIAPDLGLGRLYVIGSYGTASASELIINSLRGIDFPVMLIGGKTEGKNVGMTTTETTYNGRIYQFSPITFRVANAKGFGDYPDGFDPDIIVNNQNNSFSDDADNLFPYSYGDWGDMHFNVALRIAYEQIMGIPSEIPASSVVFDPHQAQERVLRPGCYGNIIYSEEYR